MFKAKNFWVILTIAYWFLAFFNLIADTFFPNYKPDTYIVKHIMPLKYRMYTKPPTADAKVTFVWYNKNEILLELTPQDSLVKKWQSNSFGLDTKLIANQNLAIYTRSTFFGRNNFIERYKNEIRAKPQWLIAQEFKQGPYWATAKRHWKVIGKQQLQTYPVLQDADNLVLYFYQIPYDTYSNIKKNPSTALPNYFVADTLQITEL